MIGGGERTGRCQCDMFISLFLFSFLTNTTMGACKVLKEVVEARIELEMTAEMTADYIMII